MAKKKDPNKKEFDKRDFPDNVGIDQDGNLQYTFNFTGHEAFQAASNLERTNKIIKDLEESNRLTELLENARKNIEQIFNDVKLKEPASLQVIVKTVAEMVTNIIENNESFISIIAEWEELKPYIEEEIKKPEYGGITIDELFNGDLEKTTPLLENALLAARLTKKVADSLPQLQGTGTPKYYTSPNTTLINAMQANDGKGELIGAGPIDLPVMNINKHNEVTVYAIASLENMEGLTLTGKPFTEYDRAVHDAVVSLYEDRIKSGHPPIMTADMVYRTMTHKTNAEAVSAQQKGAVTKSIEKMRKNISVFADASEEMKKRKVTINGKPVTTFKIDGFMLDAKKVTIKAGGEKVEAYILGDEPIMLNYAKLTGQLITVNGKLLDIKAVDDKGNVTDIAIPNNTNRISIKSYLLRRVEVMRNDEKRAADTFRKYEERRKKDKTIEPASISKFRKQSHTILFETLFNSTGITANNSKTKARDYVCLVLDYWKASGAIKNYTKRKSGKTIDAVIIDI